jgi:hypothetical protein
MTLTEALPGSVAPRYGDASIVDIMPGALATLGVTGGADPLGLATRLDGVRRIAVLLVDGLGYHQLDAVAEVAPTIADIRAGRIGHLAKITAGFPSTTPVSLAGLTTGEPPGTHGILGFTLRVPGSTRVLNHIRWADDPPPAVWQPVPTVFETARAAGIATTVVSRTAFAGSGLTVAVYRGAHYRGADDIDSLADAMIEALSAGAGPALVYGYHPSLDTAGHAGGVGSERWLTEARRLERLVAHLASRLPADAALLITADHGQLNVPDDARFDLDGDPRLRAGVEIVAGEPRVRNLHTTPGATSDVLATWTGVLGDAAWVMSRDEAVATGLYGVVSPAHRDRLGDVVVVCRDHYAVIASSTETRENRMIGMHASTTPAEMEIPLITLRW